MNVRHTLTARGERSRLTMIRRLAIMFTEEHRHEATTASFTMAFAVALIASSAIPAFCQSSSSLKARCS
jgi:hypothetical protein